VEAAEDLFSGRSPGHSSTRLSEIIEGRYRRRGFKIVWLLFGREGQEAIPETERMSEIFATRNEDLLISSRVSFHAHTSQNLYPQLKPIFDRLPKPLEEVVVGGFHQWDCVDKTAGYIWKQGIPCRVDEDTTELFFHQRFPSRVPLNRRRGDSQLTRVLQEVPTSLIPLIRGRREEKPWFEQVEI
jgi:hypothetical protein